MKNVRIEKSKKKIETNPSSVPRRTSLGPTKHPSVSELLHEGYSNTYRTLRISSNAAAKGEKTS